MGLDRIDRVGDILQRSDCLLAALLPASHPIPSRRGDADDADNTFTGTEEIEFSDAQDTVWSGNTLPSGVCLRNRDGSGFVDSSGLPGNC